MSSRIIGLIMAGGQGTRFWPASTENTPKQFLTIYGEDPLIKQTFDRLSAFMRTDDIFVIADKKYMDLTFKTLPGLRNENYIIEPSPKNTAPCLMMANITFSAIDENSNLLVVPADHYIPDTDIFIKEMENAMEMADRKFIITSGIKPGSPHTGYGYIEFNRDSIEDLNGTGFFEVNSFKEKPDFETASEYVRSGNYYWNSGMFIYKIKHFREFMEQYSPDYFSYYIQLEESFTDREKFNRIYNTVKPDSIDYVLMEKVKEVKMFGAGFSWNDLGSWSSLYELSEKDPDGNSFKGNPVFIDTEGSLIYSESEIPVSVIGMKDTVVVVSKNGVLVSKLDELQKVKKVVNELKKRKKETIKN